jgi:hypothetical protein
VSAEAFGAGLLIVAVLAAFVLIRFIYPRRA